jgi:prepilin-type N-terminal cleavage/methylation domain-containing protein
MKKSRLADQPGFTLLELMMAIIAFGILLSIVLIGVGRQKAFQRDTVRRAHMDQLTKALALYISNYEQYPEFRGCVSGDDDLTQELMDVKLLDPEARIYDPTGPTDLTQCYYYESRGSAYRLRYVLETDKIEPIGEHYIVP